MGKPLKYLIVAEHIQSDIESGKYPIGTLIPTEQEIMEIYQVSCTTVRKAVKELVQKHYIQVKQGSGTMVMNFRTKQTYNEITSVTESLQRQGFEVTTKEVRIDIKAAVEPYCNIFHVKKGTPLARVQRIQLADGKPVCWITNYILYDLVEGLEENASKVTSLYQYLEQEYHLSIDRTLDRATAQPASFRESFLLKIPEGTAMMHINRTCYQKNVPVSYDEVRIIGSQYEMEIQTISSEF